MSEPAPAPLYYADGLRVLARPVESKTGVTMGFMICIVSEDVGPAGALVIATALNQYDPPSKED